MQRDTRICENIGLVHACARRFKGRGMEYDDLFQAGCVGLVKAADHFDEGRGLCFSTYAVPVIMGEIRRLFRDGGSVKVGRTLKELSLKVSRERDRFCQLQQREPTVGELAECLSVSPEEVAEALNASLPTISLTRYDNEDEETQMEIAVPAPDESLTDRLALWQVLSSLPEQDRKLIVLRYLQHKTQQITAEQLGMTQVQVSRRERVILSEMRRKMIG